MDICPGSHNKALVFQHNHQRYSKPAFVPSDLDDIVGIFELPLRPLAFLGVDHRHLFLEMLYLLQLKRVYFKHNITHFVFL